MNNINKLPKIYRDKVIELLDDPSITQASIVEEINSLAKKKIISKSSLGRFVSFREKFTGTKRGVDTPCVEASLLRIAVGLETISDLLEKQRKK